MNKETEQIPKVRPMLFSTPMVKAILDGSKTQTRRIVKFPKDFTGQVFNNSSYGLKYSSSISRDTVQRLNYAMPEDIIWVRETFYAYGRWVKNVLTKSGKQKYKFNDFTLISNSDFEYHYENSKPQRIQSGKTNTIGWYKRPSLFMPKKACRSWLKITNVFAERLNDISAEDCQKEGIEFIENEKSIGYKLYGNHLIGDLLGRKAVTGTEFESYQTLWESINGEHSWDDNPWVWVIEFEPIERPKDFK